jgi:hypothetical protein
VKRSLGLLKEFCAAGLAVAGWVVSLGPDEAWARNRFRGVLQAETQYELEENEPVNGFFYDQTVRFAPYRRHPDWSVNSRFLFRLRSPPQRFSILPPVGEKRLYGAEARQVSLDGAIGNFALRLGLQEVVWGETLFVPPTDIWQPVQGESDLFLEPEFRRKPQISANFLWADDLFSLEAQFLPVPWPSLPDDVATAPRSLKDFGAGARIGARMGNLEMKVFYASLKDFAGPVVPLANPDLLRGGNMWAPTAAWRCGMRWCVGMVFGSALPTKTFTQVSWESMCPWAKVTSLGSIKSTPEIIPTKCRILDTGRPRSGVTRFGIWSLRFFI